MADDYTPNQLREMIRSGQWTTLTSGIAKGYIQANVVILPYEEAFNFLLFCSRNPKPCPVLDVLEPGQVEPTIAPGADLRTDVPKYRIFKDGEMEAEVEAVTDVYTDDMVGFLLGCSFSFENALMAAGVPVRNIEEEKNVSMFITNRQCRSVGPFTGPMVVTMRPMTPGQAVRATQITTRFHLTHGAPVHIGSPEEIGITDLSQPDFGDPCTIRSGEVPVFWACGVTTQMAVLSAALPLVITHSPGHMFVSDMKDEELTIL